MTTQLLMMAFFLVLAALVIFQVIMFHVERKREEDRQEKLLNRIMARTYEIFIQGEVAKAHADAEAKREPVRQSEEEIALDVT